MTRFVWAVGLSMLWGGAGLSAAGGTTSLYQRGVTAYFARDYVAAEATLEDAVESSSDPRAWYFKGLAERAQSKHAEAQESIHQGAALLAEGRGDVADVRRSLERVQGPARAYLEAVQSFYAKTHEDPAQVIVAPSPTEELAQFVSTLGSDDKQKVAVVVETEQPGAIPNVIESAPAYPMPTPVRLASCSSGAGCGGSVVSTSVDSPVVTSSGCGSVVSGSYGCDGGCGVYSGGCGWGGCRTRVHCGRWRYRQVTTCWGGGSGCGGYSTGCGYSGDSGCGSWGDAGCGASLGCGSTVYGGCGTGCSSSGWGCGRFGFRARACCW